MGGLARNNQPSWDFSQVLELSQVLSFGGPAPVTSRCDADARSKARPSGLGDLANVFQYLGLPEDVPVVKKTRETSADKTCENEACIGGMFMCQGLSEALNEIRINEPDAEETDVSKTDDPEIKDPETRVQRPNPFQPTNAQEATLRSEDTDSGERSGPVAEKPQLSKSQRKSRNKRLKADAKKRLVEAIDTLPETDEHTTPFTRADAKKQLMEDINTVLTNPEHITSSARTTAVKPPLREHGTNGKPSKIAEKAPIAHVKKDQPQTPCPPGRGQVGPNQASHAQTDPYPRFGNLSDRFNTPSAQSPANGTKQNFPVQPVATPGPVLPIPTGPKNMSQPKRGIGSKSYSNIDERNLALHKKLLDKFPQSTKYLVAPANLINHGCDPKGIHVFVDYSNIYFGLKDRLKIIHRVNSLPDIDMSFDSLALLLERRRPVAKRVLAGSNPAIPAFEIAESVGYQLSILERVLKARKLTERQVHFRDYELRRFGRSPKGVPQGNAASGVSGSGNVSGSETNTPQFAPPKFIEQGVDEILHMKMLESIVDTPGAATMVLATGDAAAAEYSDGFLRNVMRALENGWTVELASWSGSINKEYQKMEASGRWGERFKIIYLDDYAEEFLAM